MPADPARIGIWGLGREGKANLAFLAARYPQADVTLLTDSDAPQDSDWLAGHALLQGDAARTAIASGAFDLLVKTPGISLRREELAAAAAHGTKVTSGTNLWMEHRRNGTVIGVTGTKGKSTTSTLLLHLLRNQGLDAKLLGNAGDPAIAAEPARDITILELSSYQIADLAHAPDIAVLTNLYPEHVPWHGSLENYYTEKLRLLTLDSSVPAAANFSDDETQRRLAGRANLHWFNQPEGYHVTDGALHYRADPVTIIGDAPPGIHNLGNLAAAATAARLAGALADPLTIDLTGFAGLPHRLQAFAVTDGITGVDDSISTVPQATLAAMAVYEGRPISLIVGGSDRGQDYTALAEYLATSSVAGIYLLPDTGHAIAGLLADKAPAIPCHICADLDEAVAMIRRDAAPDAVVLLSPAAPSFVQFASFEERGDRFRALCLAAWAK